PPDLSVSYLYSTAQVIALVRAAYANSGSVDSTTNLLAAENEQGAHIAVGTGGVLGAGQQFGATASGLIQHNAQYALVISAAGVASSANRAVTLDVGRNALVGGVLPLPFFRLVADFNGDHILDNSDLTL